MAVVFSAIFDNNELVGPYEMTREDARHLCREFVKSVVVLNITVSDGNVIHTWDTGIGWVTN